MLSDNGRDLMLLGFEDILRDRNYCDHDFNDAVIDYNFNQVTNGDNRLVEIYGTFILRAQGAYFHNGFGFELPIDNALVAQVSGDMNVPGNIVSLDSRNLENGQTNAVIMLWEDGYDVLPHPGNGIGVNTEPDAPYVEPDTMHIHITFTQPIDLADIGNPPYNPFIFADGQRGVEIHLIDHLPTDLADTDLFGQNSDNSDPANGKYYRTKTNLPWGLNIIEHFDYPVEKVEITSTYLKFAEWAESNGQVSYDWFKDKAGYRNNENIYHVPEAGTK